MKDPFNKPPQTPGENREKLDFKVAVAAPEDWEEYKKIRILAVSGEDAALMGMHSGDVEQDTAKTEEEWRKELSSDNASVLFAKSGSKIIGMVLLGRFIREPRNRWSLSHLYTVKDFRKQGVGKGLIEEAKKEVARKEGVVIFTGNMNINPGSIALQRSLGFTDVAEGTLRKEALRPDSTMLRFDLPPKVE